MIQLVVSKQKFVVGIDQSAGMLARAKDRFPEARYEKLGLQEMDFQEAFDMEEVSTGKGCGWWVTMVLCAFVGALIGYAIGNSVARDTVSGKFIEWELVLLPDGQQPDHFVVGEGTTIDESSVYVVTKQDKLLVQHLSVGGYDDWEEVEQVSLEPTPHHYGFCSLEPKLYGPIREPPGVIVEQLDCEAYSVEPISSFRYVILENDELWRWERPELGLGVILVHVQYSVRYTIGGTLIGLLLFILLSKVGQSNPHH